MKKFGKEDFQSLVTESLNRNQIAQYEAPPAGCFREEFEYMKMWFSSHNFMTNVGEASNTKEAQSRNMINICNKYTGFALVHKWS